MRSLDYQKRMEIGYNNTKEITIVKYLRSLQLTFRKRQEDLTSQYFVILDLVFVVIN